MSKIRVLPEEVANQIAAGEVIERPASIVRELLDNSIDAGADRIVIRIEEGGKRLIRLSDNGIGMNRDDILLSLERHATSKIKSISDLFSIKTLGFRGEALPSICSVSRMEITSRPADQLVGYSLKAAGGELISIDETGAPAGTTIQVRDIFFNTPARRKFLKADKTETNHILDSLSRIVLPHNHVQLRLEEGGRSLLHLPALESELDRLSALLGRDVAVSLIHTSKDMNGIKIRAYLAPPDINRNRGDRIYIYVNRRSIRDKLVTRSVMEGYGRRLMKGRYPQAVIFIEMDPSLVDINVHPAKQEVRFHQSRLVFQSLSSTIEKVLKDQFSTFTEGAYQNQDILIKKQPDATSVMDVMEPAWEYSAGLREESAGTVREPLQKRLIEKAPRFIGQLKDTYLLFETAEGLLIVDQHACHERILYENLKRSYGSSKMEIQAFLIPQSLELSVREGRLLSDKSDQLKALGFEIENFGGNTFLLRSVPSVLVDTDWNQFLLDLIPILEEEADLTREKAMDRLLTIMACHGAIRAGEKMSPMESLLLLEQLEKMDLPTNCPHGRPIFKRMPYYEIEKIFKRIV